MEWMIKRASELYISSSGLSKSADQFGFGYPFLSYADIFHNYYTPSELKALVNSSEQERKKCSVKEGDIFLTRTSETTEELGMSCVALKDYPNTTFNGFAKRLRPLTDEIRPLYADYFFRSSFFRSQCMSMASLITRASLNDGNIRRLKIRYPKSKTTQEKIDKILFSYDSLIENNTKRIQILEQMAENLYKEWFIRFRFPDHETIPIIDNFPQGWKIEKLETVCAFKRGKNITAAEMVEGDIPVISAGISEAGYHNHANVKGTSVTISSSGANASYLSIHYGDIWAADCSYISDTETEDIFYLYQMLHNLRPLIGNLQRGAAQPHVYTKDVNRLKVCIPDKTLRLKANKIFGEMHNHISILLKENLNLIRQRDLLLSRLMSGKLEVKL